MGKGKFDGRQAKHDYLIFQRGDRRQNFKSLSLKSNVLSPLTCWREANKMFFFSLTMFKSEVPGTNRIFHIKGNIR
jgi:hypothetical protein